jgi:hypothetical protein
MRLHEGERWPVPADTAVKDLDGDGPDELIPATLVNVRGSRVPAATLRRVGWLDQRGRVWLGTPPCATFDGGSLTPLLIDARDD